MNFLTLLKKRISELPKTQKVALYPNNNIAKKLYKYCVSQNRPAEIILDLSEKHEVVVVCADNEKCGVLQEIANSNFGSNYPQIILAGTKHATSNQIKANKIEKELPIVSHANGYEFTKAHLFECLTQIKRMNLRGYIIELGTYEGGTLGLIDKICEILKIHNQAKLVGFDSWDGKFHHTEFLDLFDMEEYVGKDIGAARKNLPKDVSLIKGDIGDTFPKWAQSADLPIVMAFVDTDNYHPVKISLPLLWEKLAVGGCAVFDHYYTYENFFNTIGEHIAAKEFFSNRDDFFNLTGTGVFLKIK